MGGETTRRFKNMEGQFRRNTLDRPIRQGTWLTANLRTVEPAQIPYTLLVSLRRAHLLFPAYAFLQLFVLFM